MYILAGRGTPSNAYGATRNRFLRGFQSCFVALARLKTTRPGIENFQESQRVCLLVRRKTVDGKRASWSAGN